MFSIARIIIAGAVYWGLCKASLSLAEYAHGISTVWLASGFGFALYRTHGWKYLPAIWLGGFVCGVEYNTPLAAALFSSCDILGIWAGNLMMARVAGRGKIFDQTKRVVAFLFLGALPCALISAWSGVAAAITLGGVSPGDTILAFWIWFLSNLTSVIVIAPAVLAWWQYGFLRRFANNIIEMVSLISLVVLLGWTLYGHTYSALLSQYPLVFIFTPIQAWAAFRLGHRGLLNLILLSTGMAIWGTLADRGPFSGQPFPQNLMLVQAYSLVMNATTMLIHVVVYERRVATKSLVYSQDSTMQALASLAETRDKDTGDHIIRTQNYVRILAEELRQIRGYRAQLGKDTIELLYKTSALHDIGKVGVPDAILLKAGKLTPEEFEVVKRHTVVGHDSLKRATDRLGASSPFLDLAAEIALCHHEKWDGSGYPNGLKGEDIPLAGRIMALADVYDALVSARVYKKPMSHDMAMDIIIAGRGSHFDPVVVDAFVCIQREFKRIAEKYAD